ncbi:PaaI family thioesterase [Micromonospora sp. NPDC005305]|uniref:PaaI family thioesterase n=1 Tax=Micromonospora sp. NPDC005305 TaxID=3156875 RepID=UPI0033AA8896
MEDEASPEVRERITASFERQGLMRHLGARLAHIAPGRVHIVLASRPEVTQQHGYRHAGQCSALQGGGEGPRGEGRQGPSRAVDVTSAGGGTVTACGAKGSSGSSEASRRTQRDIVAAGHVETKNACGADVRPGQPPADRGEAGTRPGVARSARGAEGVPAIHGGGGSQIHAGATSAIADSAGGYAALTLFPADADVLTVEYKINLLAPAVGDYIEAIGTVLKSGGTLTVCRLEVFGVQSGQKSLVATGQQTLFCLS